jgi:hypothetical protein
MQAFGHRGVMNKGSVTAAMKAAAAPTCGPEPIKFDPSVFRAGPEGKPVACSGPMRRKWARARPKPKTVPAGRVHDS